MHTGTSIHGVLIFQKMYKGQNVPIYSQCDVMGLYVLCLLPRPDWLMISDGKFKRQADHRMFAVAIPCPSTIDELENMNLQSRV